MRRRLLPVLLAVVVANVPGHALDYALRVHGAAAYVVPVADSATDALGWEVGVELKPSSLIGIELAYLNANPEVELAGTTAGEIALEPINLSANFHVVRTTLLTFWVGPTVSYANWGNLELSDGSEIETDAEIAYGASAGINVAFVKVAALQAGVRWLKLDVTDGATGESFNVDPFFVSLGLALHF